MSTVLITYSPPEPIPASDNADPDRSFECATSGIDRAIALTIREALSQAGHAVTCRPERADPADAGFDLVIGVHGLRVSHRAGTADSSDTKPVGSAPPCPVWGLGGSSSIPMTWCADGRAVHAWAQTLAENLQSYLWTHRELVAVRTELRRCQRLLADLTSPHQSNDAALGSTVLTLPPPHDPSNGRNHHVHDQPPHQQPSRRPRGRP